MTVANPFFAAYEFPKVLDHRGRREVICENKAAASSTTRQGFVVGEK